MAFWGLLALILAACGGGKGGGPEIQVHLRGAWGQPGLGFVAYQAEDGEWQPTLPVGPGEFRFRLPAGANRYGVAVSCWASGRLQAWAGHVFVYQLTVADARELRVPCSGSGNEPETDTLSVNYDLGAVGGDRLKVLAPSWFPVSKQVSSGKLSVPAFAGTQRDFLALGYAGSYDYRVLKGIRRFRADVPGSYNLSFTSSEEVDFGTGKNTGVIEGFAIPTGYSGRSEVGYIIPNGPATLWGFFAGPALGEGDETGGEFAKVPEPIAGDLYVVSASAEAGSSWIQSLVYLPATEVSDTLTPASLPDPWPSGYTVQPAVRPTFLLNHPGEPVGYEITLATSVLGCLGGCIEVYVSPGWLGPERSYRIPDLTALSGFGGALPRSGEHIYWSVAAWFADADWRAVFSPDDWFGRGIWLPVFPGGSLGIARLGDDFTVP